MRQLPLTLTNQVPFRAPCNSCRSKPGRLRSRASAPLRARLIRGRSTPIPGRLGSGEPGIPDQLYTSTSPGPAPLARASQLTILPTGQDFTRAQRSVAVAIARRVYVRLERVMNRDPDTRPCVQDLVTPTKDLFVRRHFVVDPDVEGINRTAPGASHGQDTST